MSFLSAVSESSGVYILEKPDELAISEQWHSRKKISIINTPQAILLLMFILHTFMGALSKSKMCSEWIKKTWESPHYYYHYYCPEISPLAL